MAETSTFERYGALWKVGTLDLDIEMACIRREGSWKSKNGQQCGAGLPRHYEHMRRILWPHLDGEHNGQRWHVLCRDTCLENKITVLMGAACVAGHTRLFDPLTGAQPTVLELWQRQAQPTVLTLNGPRLASVPFIKGRAELFDVKLDDGSTFRVTGRHRVLTARGFARVSQLQIGECLFSCAQTRQESTLESGLSIPSPDAPSFQRKVEDSQLHCFAGFCPDDEQLLAAREAVRWPSPLQADVHEHSRAGSRADAHGHARAHSRPCQRSALLSNSDASRREHRWGIPASRHEPAGNALHGVCSSQSVSQWPSGSTHQRPVAKLNQHSSSRHHRDRIQCAAETFRPVFSEHCAPPGLTCENVLRPDPATCPAENLQAMPDRASQFVVGTYSRVSTARVLSITSAGEDWFFDLTVPVEEHYFAEGVIHHNSTGKTHSAAWLYLCEYLCFPDETCVLVSSTDIRGLKKRVWGEIADLWSKAIERFDHLPGHMLDAAIAIATDSLEDIDFGERKVRDMRKGIFGVPCMNSQNTFVGLTKYHGIKQKRMRLIADEASMMGHSFLNSFANLNANEDFRAIILGNPADCFDPLGKSSCPLDGWDGEYMNPEKTSVWKTKFMRGKCVNLVGTDSPNFDFPADQPTRFKYLISREKIAETITGFQKDSYEYHNQVLGTMMTGQLARRVLTHRICEEGRATETDVSWEGSARTKVYFVDAAYGGDRCVAVWGEFGKIVGGSTVLLLHPPALIPISPRSEKEPEQQIAEYVKRDCIGLGILPANMGHDATGRGSLGTYLAREWSADTNPVESGGAPTDRPVSLDIFTWERKGGTGPLIKRPKLCKEHYVKRVSEYWFSVRYAVIAGQVRGMTSETIDEFCQREWDRVAGDKIEIESKLDMKDRMGRSPDLADAVAGVLEMARRRGFSISKLGNESAAAKSSVWLDDLRRRQVALLSSKQLVAV